MVRIFEDSIATPYSFFIQAKSTDHVSNYVNRSGSLIEYPVSTAHFEHWKNFWEPIILTVWDSASDTTYWEIVQDHIIDEGKKGKKTLRIPLSKQNVLDNDGINRILKRTKSRFARFEQEREGAQILVELLQEKLGVEIDYNPQAGSLIIINHHGEWEITAFGKLGRIIQAAARKRGIATKDVLLKAAESYLDQDNRWTQAFIKGSKISAKEANGEIIGIYDNLQELRQSVGRKFELYGENYSEWPSVTYEILPPE